MKSFRILLLLALMVVFAAPMAQAQNYVRKIDSFDFLVDNSGSMQMNSTTLKMQKIKAAKQVLTSITNAIPNLGYKGSLHTFAPVSTIVPQGDFAASSMNAGIAKLNENLDIFGRLTPMGDGLLDLSPEYRQMARPSAVIIASDGENNRGIDPVAEARSLYEAVPNICIHVVSFADSAEGQATLDAISKLNPCSVNVKGADLLASSAAVDKFVNDVFVSSVMEEVIVLRGVNFAFDSYALDSSATSILNEVAAIVKSANKPILLQGWTDAIGTDAYNATLSMNRAVAVRNYLEKQGISAGLMTVDGMGKSFKYDNSTPEGRYLNRRTEISFR